MDIDFVLKPCFDVFQEIGEQVKDERQYILRKLVSNLEAINVLLLNNCTHEIKIILRSAIESAILFIYLTSFPEKIAEYTLASEIAEFKSVFIIFKEYQNDYNKGQETLEECEKIKKMVIECFEESLSSEAKDYVLNKLNLSKFCINEANFISLDKFFRNDEILKKAFFCKIEQMFKEIPLIDGYDITLRETFYCNYNNYSQIIHGQLIKWMRESLADEIFQQEIKNVIHNIILIPLIYAERNGIVLSKENKQNFNLALTKLIPRNL